MYKFKNDKYKSSRGGHSRLLDISCEECSAHICYYQKDGPGILKRIYFDRIIGLEPNNQQLTCPQCSKVLGVETVYEKESRDAYRLFVGAVTKKITKSSSLI